MDKEQKIKIRWKVFRSFKRYIGTLLVTGIMGLLIAFVIYLLKKDLQSFEESQTASFFVEFAVPTFLTYFFLNSVNNIIDILGTKVERRSATFSFILVFYCLCLILAFIIYELLIDNHMMWILIAAGIVGLILDVLSFGEKSSCVIRNNLEFDNSRVSG